VNAAVAEGFVVVNDAVANAPASTAAGGKIAFVALYHIKSVAAAAPCAACGGSSRDANLKAPKESVAEQSVPERKPWGRGGVGPTKKIMPDAIIGGTNNCRPNNGSSAPSAEQPANKPMPAKAVSITLRRRSGWSNDECCC